MKLYVASAMPTDYPHKLQKPSTVSNRVRDTATSFIMDSGIGDDVSNEEVLDLAAEHDADYVVGKDVLHDFQATSENVWRFLELYDDHACTATPMVPVQCNPNEGVWHADHVPELPDTGHYVLGGMAVPEVSTTDQIKSSRECRETVGEDAYVHGLGVGGGMEFVSKVAGTGWLDSVDCSTPEQAAMFGAVLDERLRQRETMVFGGGEGKSQRTYPLAEYNSYQVRDVWEREADYGGLANYE